MESILKYGVRWKTDDPIVVELKLYAMPEDARARIPGALPRSEHLRRAIKLLLPEGSGLEWHWWIDILIDRWCERDILSVWGPSSAGKSSIIGLLSYVDLLAAPADTLTIYITDKLTGHDSRAWSNVLHWRNLMPAQWQIGTINNSQNQKRLVTTVGGRIAGIYCTSTESGDSVSDMKKKLGGHNKRNRLVVDEAQTCGDSVLQLKMNLGASGEYKEILFGNPDSWSNPLGVHSDPADDDREKTLDRDLTEWETKAEWHGKRGLCIVFDGRNSPACASDREAKRLHFLPSRADLANYAKQEGGEDSPSFWTYAVGRIPPGGFHPVVLSEADWRESGVINRRPWATSAKRQKFVGVDLSMGGDGIPVYLFELGATQEGSASFGAMAVTGKMVLQLVKETKVHVNVREHDYSGQIAAQIVERVKVWEAEWTDTIFDSTGSGAPIIDRVEVIAGCPGKCVRVNSSHAVSSRLVGPKREPAKNRFGTRAAELLWQVAEAIRRGLVWGLPAIIGDQLTTRGLFDKSGKLEVQPKLEWKKQHKGRSPDEADTVAVVIDELLRRGLLRLDVDRPGAPPKWGGPEWMDPEGKRGGTISRRRRVTRLMRG